MSTEVAKNKKKMKMMIEGLDKNFRLREISPKNDAQTDTFTAWSEGYHLLLHGVAGTGKSYISMYLALRDLFNMKYKKVIIIRSIVSSRDPGFLPGTLTEKSAIYEHPYQEITADLFNRKEAYQMLKTGGVLEFNTTSFLRGHTISDAVIIVDEIQNMTFQELDTVITRVGENSKLVLCGDVSQNDLIRKLNDVSGLKDFMDIIMEMKSFDCVEFEIDDIVRSGLVKEYITTKTKMGRF